MRYLKLVVVFKKNSKVTMRAARTKHLIIYASEINEKGFQKCTLKYILPMPSKQK